MRVGVEPSLARGMAMPRMYSRDLHDRILATAREERLSQPALATRIRLSETTVYNWLRRLPDTGEHCGAAAAPRPWPRSKPRSGPCSTLSPLPMPGAGLPTAASPAQSEWRSAVESRRRRLVRWCLPERSTAIELSTKPWEDYL